MMAAEILKSLCPKLFYVTYVAYLLHNCAMKVNGNFEHVDQLTSKVKSETVKSVTRQVKFATICCPAYPADGKWVS